jgi:hypothetical protein
MRSFDPLSGIWGALVVGSLLLGRIDVGSILERTA